MKKQMKQKLFNLAAGELVSVIVFWINYFIFKKMIIVTNSLGPISFSLFVLSFILVQGAAFWCILIKRMSKPRFAVKYTGKIYNVFKAIDQILLCIGLAMIIFNDSKSFSNLISFAIWGFAVIEWINYYKIQLSYSFNPLVLFKFMLQGKLRKSRISKEIDKSLNSIKYHD
ncbi:hypothetical protein QU661_05800 [Mogibacterium neglectum]|uniref:hypothetical protein n=1 Tax=Mogibacterium neglectum TaxID=114528 RepID=UPI002729C05B|nr:hypothetical protein [Mogibacterium neglectum]WLD75794.1 hypothetical protein QU661_05800 [Mogibacterium neglectum]